MKKYTTEFQLNHKFAKNAHYFNKKITNLQCVDVEHSLDGKLHIKSQQPYKQDCHAKIQFVVRLSMAKKQRKTYERFIAIRRKIYYSIIGTGAVVPVPKQRKGPDILGKRRRNLEE